MGSGADFALEVYYDGEKNVLRGVLAGGADDTGRTELSEGTWYLTQINTRMYGGYEMVTVGEKFRLEMDVHLGETTDPELSVEGYGVVDDIKNSPLVSFSGGNNDGFDELRHLDRELYLGEISDYGAFLKQGRVAGKSKGSLGNVGW